MTEIRIKTQLNEDQEKRLSYLKKLFGVKTNSGVFKKLLEIKL